MFTLPQRILFYFAAAPDEELSLHDIAIKTGAHDRTVGDAIKLLRDSGAVTSRQTRAPRMLLIQLTPEARAVMLAPLAPLDSEDQPD